jgi:DNA-binding MarR family transcriptional regulator
VGWNPFVNQSCELVGAHWNGAVGADNPMPGDVVRRVGQRLSDLAWCCWVDIAICGHQSLRDGADAVEDAVVRRFTRRHLTFRLRPSDLAQAMGTGASNISKILKRLEAGGLVERGADPHDARSTTIALTPAGEEAARHIYDLGDAMIAQVLAGWSPRDIARFTELTKRFTADAIAAAQDMRREGLRYRAG